MQDTASLQHAVSSSSSSSSSSPIFSPASLALSLLLPLSPFFLPSVFLPTGTRELLRGFVLQCVSAAAAAAAAAAASAVFFLLQRAMKILSSSRDHVTSATGDTPPSASAFAMGITSHASHPLWSSEAVPRTPGVLCRPPKLLLLLLLLLLHLIRSLFFFSFSRVVHS